MRVLALNLLCFLLLPFLSMRVEAQILQLSIQKQGNQKFTLSCYVEALDRHTFIESSTTNHLWFPAYFSRSNSNDGFVHTLTNTGGIKLFKATQDHTIAQKVTSSWQRIGITNYVFHYTRVCFCAPNFMVSATVTVMSDEVVKVENARDRQGNPVANPSLSASPTINELLDAWIASEPNGGHARELKFDPNGFPMVINIDLDPRLADEELIYTIDSFTPFP